MELLEELDKKTAAEILVGMKTASERMLGAHEAEENCGLEVQGA